MTTPRTSHGLDSFLRDRAHRRLALALAPAVATILVAVLLAPLPQPVAYHDFHDHRTWLGIPNVLNVLSNLPFAAIGIMGLVFLASGRAALPRHLLRCYQVMFGGVLVTAFGSAYYHLAPSNASLLWDRLPIAVGFMGLYAACLIEHLDLAPRTSQRLLAGLVSYGLASVLYWAAYDDLRFYVIVQGYALLTIPLLVWLRPSRYARQWDWVGALAFYVGAKCLEEMDGAVFGIGGRVSGHTLKHLAAAVGAYWIYRMLRRRQGGARLAIASNVAPAVAPSRHTAPQQGAVKEPA